MADQKVTKMVLKVDLQCPRCYKKIKKILCKFPQIRDQVFDEKQNTVTITVVCCSPEKIRGKLCCKGGKTIKCIEIVVPPKPKPKEPPKQPEKPKEPPKQPAKPTAKPTEIERPNEDNDTKEIKKSKEPEKPKEAEKTITEPPKQPEPVQGYPPVYPIVGVCFDGCYHGCERPKPCYCGCGRSAPCCDNPRPQPQPQPQPCYCGCGRSAPCYDGYYGKPCSASVYYFTDENPSACTIM
ncbi:hypothetical protein F0562_013468 [Nyssa sinensis]|uniref:HMA domain-containing protein n=1 Tax=Nyssa sinensis TaxID=561372 RepID=A0A5J4ZNZ8_9ASTE|nr:hypothetical protein F0562_013468 [Nyssa sinensis]